MLMSKILLQYGREGSENSTWHLSEDLLTRIGRGYVRDMALSPDGSLLVAATDLGLWWYDVDTCELLTLWEAGNAASNVTFSACGEWIAASIGMPLIKVLDVKSGERLAGLTRAKNEITSQLVFAPDRKRLAAGGMVNLFERETRLHYSVETWVLQQEGPVSERIESEHIYAGTDPIAFSPDSRLLAFAIFTKEHEPYNFDGFPVDISKTVCQSGKNCISVCDVTTGKHITTLKGFNNVASLSFSPCGRFLAVGDYKGPIRVWKVPNDLSSETSSWSLYKVYQEIEDTDTSHYVIHSPEGSLRTAAFSINKKSVVVREPERGEVLFEHLGDTRLYKPDFSKGERLAFASETDVHVWTVGKKDSICVSQLHGLPPSSLNFSLDGKKLFACLWRLGIFSWDVAFPDRAPHVFKPLGKSTLKTLQYERYMSIVVSPEGKLFVTSGDENTLRLWELHSEMPIATFLIKTEATTASFSPTANLIACRDDSDNIYIWDVITGKLRDTYICEEDVSNTDLTFSPNGAYLSCGSCCLYDVVRREHIDKFTSENVEFQAFSPNSAYIWDTAPTDETIRLWDIHQCEVVMSLRKPEPEPWEEKRVETLTLSTCGKYLACSLYTHGTKSRLFVWDTHKGDTPIAIFEKGVELISSLVFSLDSTLLASGMEDGTILLWDLKPYLRNT